MRGNLNLTTTEKPSLRGNEVAVAIPLFAIHNLQGVIANERSECGNPINDYYGMVLMFFKTNTMRENMRFLTMFGMTPSE